MSHTRESFTAWAGAQLSGTGWTLATMRFATGADGDLAGAALADGFAAAAWAQADGSVEALLAVEAAAAAVVTE